jgi:hypothetical protein
MGGAIGRAPRLTATDDVMSNRVSVRWLAGLVLVYAAIVVGALPPNLARAQAEETRYFPETGHNVSGEFLSFYQENGGLAILGYPLTREFEEKGLRVQYFQRARLELVPESPESARVQLGPLGTELGYGQPALSAAEILPFTHPDKRYYPETGHTVAFAFLEFYEDNGGPALFGYPITEWIVELNGRIVQYFERAKLEWYPENPPGQRVQPGMLGVIYVEQNIDPVYTGREDPFVLSTSATSAPDPASGPPAVPLTVTDIHMLTTVKHPIIGLQDTQTIYVYVLDQSGQGVKDASVDVEVQYKNGGTDRFSIQNTNANGYGQIDFAIGDLSPGYVVIVSLHARYAGLEASTRSAFLPWW